MTNIQQLRKHNGNMCEIWALEILNDKFSNVEYVDNLIDFYAENHIPIEIKSCQFLINSGNPKYPKRYGRFKLDKEQHNFLEIQQGYYLFLVHSGDLIINYKLIPAVDIPFMQQITWRELVDRPNFEIPGVN